MYDQVVSCIRRATREQEKMNILCAPTHERYQSNLALTGENFCMYQHPTFVKWKPKYAALPENCMLFNGDLGDAQIPIDFTFDIILSQHKYSQFQILSKVGAKYGIPHINLEHTWPVNFSQEQISTWKNMRANVNVFISEESRAAWGWKDDEAIVIHHGIDTDVFCTWEEKHTGLANRHNKPLSVVNDWANRDAPCGFNLWREATKDLQVVVVGDNPGISKAAENTDELVAAYQKAAIFVNTSLQSPVPTSLLEAMACGCAVVSTDTCMIPGIIKHGVNGLLANPNKPEDINKYIKQLQNDNDMCTELGVNARATILEKFTLKQFVDNWGKVFNTFR